MTPPSVHQPPTKGRPTASISGQAPQGPSTNNRGAKPLAPASTSSQLQDCPPSGNGSGRLPKQQDALASFHSLAHQQNSHGFSSDQPIHPFLNNPAVEHLAGRPMDSRMAKSGTRTVPADMLHGASHTSAAAPRTSDLTSQHSLRSMEGGTCHADSVELEKQLSDIIQRFCRQPQTAEASRSLIRELEDCMKRRNGSAFGGIGGSRLVNLEGGQLQVDLPLPSSFGESLQKPGHVMDILTGVQHVQQRSVPPNSTTPTNPQTRANRPPNKEHRGPSASSSKGDSTPPCDFARVSPEARKGVGVAYNGIRMMDPNELRVFLETQESSEYYDPSKPGTNEKDEYRDDEDAGYRETRYSESELERQTNERINGPMKVDRGQEKPTYEPLFDYEARAEFLELRTQKKKSHPAPQAFGQQQDPGDELLGAHLPNVMSESVTEGYPVARTISDHSSTQQGPLSDAKPAAPRKESPKFGGPSGPGGAMMDSPEGDCNRSFLGLTPRPRPMVNNVEILGRKIDREQVKKDYERWKAYQDDLRRPGRHPLTNVKRPPQCAGAEGFFPRPMCERSSNGDRSYGKQLDCYNLKIIYEQDRTGFQESRDFKADDGRWIAGRYEIVSSLGQAAFSKAYKCRDTVTKELVCIKMIRNEKDYIDQSFDEIQLLRYIAANGEPWSHFCLKLIDYFYFQEHLFLVTELLGDNLYAFASKIKQYKLPPYFTLGRVQLIAWQVLKALEHIHSLGLIHCDLKPENILMYDDKKALIRVIDFGSSCFVHDRLSTYVQSRSYRAPEVVLGLLPYDQKVDLWSLGCILAELWTGFVLFQNNNVHSMLARMAGILGPIPAYMVAEYEPNKAREHFFTNDGQLIQKCAETGARIQNEGGENVKVLLPKVTNLAQRMRTDDHLFLDFLTKLLQFDPAMRPSATKALSHDFLLPGRYKDGLKRTDKLSG